MLQYRQISFYYIVALCLSIVDSYISTYRPQLHGLQSMRGSITGGCTTMLSISLMMLLGPSQSSASKIYLTGGQGKCLSFFQFLAAQLSCLYARKIFPDAALCRRSNTSASRKALKQQRAALEREAAAWLVFFIFQAITASVFAIQFNNQTDPHT